jgi:hypothetical protein
MRVDGRHARLAGSVSLAAALSNIVDSQQFVDFGAHRGRRPRDIALGSGPAAQGSKSMSYKGHDLDLRPAGAQHEATGVGNGPDRAKREPVNVTLNVLDCFNAAFDAARVHGAREVRLEHLLHALTRVPAASVALSDLGIRVEELRRQTAMAIAAEPAGAFADGAGGPVASAPFEAVLRRAAGEAGRRGSAATLPDVLRALLESPAAMLLRQSGDAQRLDRWREETGRQALTLASLPSAGRAAEPAPAAADAVLRRLGALEAALSELQAGLAADRGAMGDVLRDLRTEVAALRTARTMPADPAQQATAEGGLTQLREDAERRWSAAIERQQALEASLRAQAEKAEEIRKSSHDVMGAIHDALVKLGARQDELSVSLAAWREETSGDLGIISSRVDRLDQAAHDRLGQLSDDVAALRPKRGVDTRHLGENLKRWAYGTRSAIATTWREGLPRDRLARYRLKYRLPKYQWPRALRRRAAAPPDPDAGEPS